MGSRNKVVALLLAVVFAFSTLFATTASAKEVNTSLSANPTAAISAIDSIGTPLSDQEAGEVRGEWLFLPAVYSALATIWAYGVIYGVPYAVNYGASLYNGTWLAKQALKDEIKQYFGWQ